MSKKAFVSFLTACIIINFFTGNVYAAPAQSVFRPFELTIQLNELTEIDFYFSESSFSSFEDSTILLSDGKKLSNSKKSIPLNTADILLASLKDMYPSPTNVTHVRWTDDYPYEEIIIKLKDGRQITATSTSQFPKAVPWNIRIWAGDPQQEETELLGSYILLNYDFHAGASKLWKAVNGENFPRNYGLDSFYWSDDEPRTTIEFYAPRIYDSFSKTGETMDVQKKKPDVVLAPFVPLLKKNSELAILFDKGYTLFDAAFDIDVMVDTLSPISYSGMIALKSPHTPDVIVSTVFILGNSDVTTPLKAEQAENEVAKRLGFSHLQYLTGFIPDIVFIHDLRSEKSENFTDLECEENKAYTQYDYRTEILSTQNENQKMTIFHLRSENSWIIDGILYREETEWSDEVIKKILERWFPSSFSSIPPETVDILNTNSSIAFRPNMTVESTKLLSLITPDFPDQVKIHHAHAQKEGDRSFAQLEGHIILPEDGNDPHVIYCGHERPSWYGDPYDIKDVKLPDAKGERVDLLGLKDDENAWTSFHIVSKTRNATFTSSTPGYLHALWTVDDEGIYYSEGWADGSGWLKPQRLADDSWNVEAFSNGNGEVHLLWSGGFEPGGSVHVWRNSKGEWQQPEYWENMGYFSSIILDNDGTIHVSWSHSDGWDSEFFYANWSKEDGLSTPENISRRQGETGNSTVILRLDPEGDIHAVWGHPLSDIQFVDPLSGEAFDTAGVFYSKRLSENNWTLPEQIGTFAPYAHSLGFDLSDTNEPVVAWQSTNGIITSSRQNEKWTRPTLLYSIDPPQQPEPFGPDRWVLATASIALERSPLGTIEAVWSAHGKGLFFAGLNGQTWSPARKIVDIQDVFNLDLKITPEGAMHIIYSASTSGYAGSFFYAKIQQDEIKTKLLGGQSDYFKLEADDAGFVYVLTHLFNSYIPAESSSLIPAPTLTPVFHTDPIPLETTITESPSFVQTPTLEVNTSFPSEKGQHSKIIMLFTISFLLCILLIYFQKRIKK